MQENEILSDTNNHHNNKTMIQRTNNHYHSNHYYSEAPYTIKPLEEEEEENEFDIAITTNNPTNTTTNNNNYNDYNSSINNTDLSINNNNNHYNNNNNNALLSSSNSETIQLLHSFHLQSQHFSLNNTNQIKKQKKKKKTKTNLFFSIYNLINDIISPGTIAMAQMVAQSGIYMSILLTFLFGFITIFTLILLFELSKIYKNKKCMFSLSELAFGKIGLIYCCFCSFLFNFGGACQMYLLFGGVLPDLLFYLFHTYFGNLNFLNLFISRNATLIYLTIILLPIASMKNLANFAIASFLSVSAMLVITILFIIEKVMGRRKVPIPNDAMSFIHPQFMSAFGGLSFIFVCHDISFHVFTEMKNPTRLRYYLVIIIVVFLTISTIFAIGITGYLLFYDNNLIHGNMLKFLPKNYSLAIFGRILLVVEITLSIPYACFMPRDGLKMIIHTIFPKIDHWIQRNTFRKEFLHYSLTILVVLSALTIALNFTDLGVISDLFGAISACNLAYIIPPLLFLKLEVWDKKFRIVENKSDNEKNHGKIIWWKVGCAIGSFIVLLIGLGIFGCSLYSVIYHKFIVNDA